jgi:hypothetical protein
MQMDPSPSDTALLDNALAAIGLVLARMDRASVPDSGAATASDAEATAEQMSIHCCLVSASSLLDVSQTLIRQPAHLSPRDRALQWDTLVGQTKAAGRAAYRAALALADPTAP